MPPLPPTDPVLEKLHHLIIPAAGGAALVMCCFLMLGRWAAALGSAAAVVVGFMAANFTVNGVDFGEKLTWENTHRLITWKPNTDPEVNTPGWHWLPRVGLVLVAVGLVSRWIGLLASRSLPERGWWAANLLVWVPRIAAVYWVSAWLASGTAASNYPNLRLELTAVLLAVWIVSDGVARAGHGAEVAAYLSLLLMAGGLLLLYAHTGKFMEIAVALGAAMFGIAVAAGLSQADTSGAIPAAVTFLTGLILGARPSLAENQVPGHSFWLIALAPLVLVPFLIPALARKQGTILRVVRLLLVFTPIVVAIVLAAQHEKLAFDEQ